MGVRALRCLFGILAALTVAGCFLDSTGPDGNQRAEASEPFSEQLDPAGSARLRLVGVNGSVTIVGGPLEGLVRVEGTRTVRSSSRSDAEQFLTQVTVQVEQEGDEISVRTLQPMATEGREVLVDYDLLVPSHLDIEVAHVNGDVDVRSIDASVNVDNVNGAVAATDVVGDVTATLANGVLTGEVTLIPGGLVDLSVSNGDIELDVPTSTSAILEADVVNGSISVSGLTILDATTSTRSVHGRLGAGDGLVDLGVVNGTITLRGR